MKESHLVGGKIAVEKEEKGSAGKSKRARITLECSQEMRKSIRVRAAQEDKSMNDYILSIVLNQMQKDSKNLAGQTSS